MKDRLDPRATAGFSDIQWFMYHQRNVAFFAAYTSRALAADDLLEAARRMVDLAPQLRLGFTGSALYRPIADDTLRRIIAVQSVPTLDGFPDRWLDSGAAVFSDPDLPLFRIRYALPTEVQDGRAGFILVQVAHALVEGEDSARLARSQAARHEAAPRLPHSAGPAAAIATAFGDVLASLHLIAGNLADLKPGPYGFATRVYPRAVFRDLARTHDVSQRALLYALVMRTIFDLDGRQPKRRISSTYSVLDAELGAGHDSFMHMQMRFATFGTDTDFGAFVRAVEGQLRRSEAKPRRFGTAVTARGLHVHRGLSRLIPFAYTPRVFRLLPFDIVLGLIPPHRLAGRLTEALREPIYAGAALEGANACVIVPNRAFVTFNFYLQRHLLPRISRLDQQLGPLISGSSGAG